MKKSIITAIAALLATSSVFGEVVINFGNDDNSGKLVPGNQWAKTDAVFSNLLIGTGEYSAYTTGSFATLPSGYSGADVSFDVVVSSSLNKVKAQPKGIGVSRAQNDASLDDGEWITVSIQNIKGIDPQKETIHIKLVGLKFTSTEESYILNDGMDTAFTGMSEVLMINSSSFKIQAGALTDSKFIINKVTFEVAPISRQSELLGFVI